MIAETLLRGSPRRARAYDFVRRLVREILQDRLLGLSAETAFFLVLSLFPALLVAASLLGMLDALVGGEVAERSQERVVGALDLILTDRADDTIASVEALFEEARGGLLTFAVLGALVTISGAWAVVINALNLAYNTEERRTWLRRRLLGLALGLVTVAVASVAFAVIAVGPLLGRGEDLADLIGLGPLFVVVWDLLRLPVLFLALTGWVMFVFHRAPNRRTPWRHSVPGALTTATLWLVATAGFHLYLRLMGDRNPVLGAFGGGAIVMIWLYLLSFALLVGGEINEVWQRRWRPDRGAAGDG